LTATILFNCPACNKEWEKINTGKRRKVQCSCGHKFILATLPLETITPKPNTPPTPLELDLPPTKPRKLHPYLWIAIIIAIVFVNIFLAREIIHRDPDGLPKRYRAVIEKHVEDSRVSLRKSGKLTPGEQRILLQELRKELTWQAKQAWETEKAMVQKIKAGK
jgi:DNA-directed RNA polymerase subunit RPC12/RpoP